MQALDFSNERNRAWKIVDSYAAGSAGTAFLTGPIPGTSAFLTGIEAKMCYDISRVYGFYPTLQEAGSTIGGLMATSGILKTVAIEAATWVPLLGWLIKSSIAYSACRGIGKIAIEYFESKSQGTV